MQPRDCTWVCLFLRDPQNGWFAFPQKGCPQKNDTPTRMRLNTPALLMKPPPFGFLEGAAGFNKVCATSHTLPRSPLLLASFLPPPPKQKQSFLSHPSTKTKREQHLEQKRHPPSPRIRSSSFRCLASFVCFLDDGAKLHHDVLFFPPSFTRT